jgi:hypothetical protein
MTMLKNYLDLGSVEAIADQLRAAETSMASGAGVAAQTACFVLVSRNLENTVHKLERTATILMWVSIVIAAVGVALTWVGLAAK